MAIDLLRNVSKLRSASVLLALVFGLYNPVSSVAEPQITKADPSIDGGLSVHESFPEVEPESPIDAILVHPLLKIPDFHGFEGRPIPQPVYKLLNTMVHRDYFLRNPNRCDRLAIRLTHGSFWRAELEASQGFCALAKGLSEGETIALAGKPTVILGQVIPWQDSEPGEKNWIYFFGYSRVQVRLVFRDGRCVKAIILSRNSNYPSYQPWRTKTIQEFAMGKTREQIQRFVGEQQPVEGYEPVQEVVAYAISSNSFVVLHFTDLRCTQVGFDVFLY